VTWLVYTASEVKDTMKEPDSSAVTLSFFPAEGPRHGSQEASPAPVDRLKFIVFSQWMVVVVVGGGGGGPEIG